MPAPAPAFTVEQRDALRAALAKGVRRIEFASGPGMVQKIEYASLSEMMAVLQMMDAVLDPAAGVPQAPSYRLASFTRAR